MEPGRHKQQIHPIVFPASAWFRICIIVSVFFLFTLPGLAQLKWPAITQTTRPWTRWWWEGSAVNKADLSWNLEQYKQAGLGGVEITPIYGVAGYERQFIRFLSPEWMQMLVHTLRESKRLGLGVDLANATGWPFGGPWVSDADASKTIYPKFYEVQGGDELAVPVEYYQPALVRTANNKAASIDTILEPVSANKNLQDLALDQIQYPGKLPLISLVAYNSQGKMIDLTKTVDEKGHLAWTAPAGSAWQLVALFQGLHGKMVERAAPGGEGYAIDHFSSRAARDYFDRFDKAFEGYDLSYLRGFFNDSYEVDDARGQANWTPDFFDQFKLRRHYDLRQYLPALFGKMDSGMNSRIIYDYRSTIDELILDHFTREWKKWGDKKGKLLRNQSHGSPANTLDLYSVVDIPETEGDDILRFKFATSAAHVTGKKLVSSESATWLNEHFLSSLGDAKKAIDLYFLGGVNHIFYHGTAYSPRSAPWPGWLFYAAVHFQPSNPQWKDFHALNEYISRVQSFLQNARPDNDILLYYPIADRYSEPGNALLQHFDGMEKNFENTDFKKVSDWMLQQGYSFDFFSDRQLLDFRTDGNQIITGGNHYRAILLPGNKLIPLASWKKLLTLVEQGVQVLFYKELPTGVPGFDNGTRTEEFEMLKGSLNFGQLDMALKYPGLSSLKMASYGRGFFLKGEDLADLVQATGARRETMLENNLWFTRGINKEGSCYFIVNRGEKIFSDWVNIPGPGASAALFDPASGKSGMAKFTPGLRGKTPFKVFIQLEPHQSVVIQIYPVRKTGPAYIYYSPAGETLPLKGDWTIDFMEGGPTLPTSITTGNLVSWSALDTGDYGNFSGVARYSVVFDKPGVANKAFRLDLGEVHETAEVILNGKRIATLVGPGFQCIIPAAWLQTRNKLEIKVANLMANRIAYMDKKHIAWKIFYNTNMPAKDRENTKNGLFDASGWKPRPSGLLGPVTLTPLDPIL